MERGGVEKNLLTAQYFLASTHERSDSFRVDASWKILSQACFQRKEGAGEGKVEQDKCMHEFRQVKGEVIWWKN